MTALKSSPKHFLDLDAIDAGELRAIIDASRQAKEATSPQDGPWGTAPLAGRTLAMVFTKPSTRTRVSFEVAIRQLGGDATILDQQGTQLGRGETIADTARVLSRFVDAIMLRTDAVERLDEMATHAEVPVINGLTDRTHPCQVMADILTLEEMRGPAADQIVAWTGDGNNVAHSWIHAAVQFGFDLRLATPPELAPDADIVKWAADKGGRVTLTDDAKQAVDGADCVVTDTFVSMGFGDNAPTDRRAILAPYQVNAALMAAAKPDAIFMHCLPAHRGEEVTAEIIDGPRSVVWAEAENRLHVQKGVLIWCLEAPTPEEATPEAPTPEETTPEAMTR
ncbi:MAG: ornithine carbamoyltransferase [Alphaproteobacteria bacterium]|nr:ornithine carbamoyltransferase [Alphaproteobacteria bacterium]